MHKKRFDRFIDEYNFIDEMPINIFPGRFEYKRVFALFRKGRKTGKYQYFYTNLLIEPLQLIKKISS